LSPLGSQVTSTAQVLPITSSTHRASTLTSPPLVFALDPHDQDRHGLRREWRPSFQSCQTSDRILDPQLLFVKCRAAPIEGGPEVGGSGLRGCHDLDQQITSTADPTSTAAATWLSAPDDLELDELGVVPVLAVEHRLAGDDVVKLLQKQ